MSSDSAKPAAAETPTQAAIPKTRALLSRVLGQSERVQDKVEKAAEGLSSVNAVLKDEMADGMPLAKVEQVLSESEAIEGKVQEAAEELVAVNDALRCTSS